MKLYYISLGCDKNLADAEHMLYDLHEAGYDIIPAPEDADVIIVNSCCFISDAMEESIDTILEMAEFKETGKLKALIVTGCLPSRFPGEIHEELPEIDAIVNTASYDRLTEVIDSVIKGKPEDAMMDLSRIPEDHGRLLSTGGHYAYLKIAEGCDKGCSYCVIPSIRGHYRSYPKEKLVKEAAELVATGVRELILVAQETTLYGVDLYGHKCLHELIEELSAIKGLAWIRILYAYPEEIYDELVEVMATNPKVCHYIDMPIQHSSDDILHLMKRRTRRDELISVVERLRKAIPDIAIRTTLMCGFPGESGDMHRENLDFIRQMKFDRLGAFVFSPQEGTEAIELPGQVDELTGQLRYDEIMRTQQKVVFDANEGLTGRVFEVIIDGALPDEEDDVYVGRTFRDAPDVDGLVFVNSSSSLMSGDIISVKITGCRDYDLIGR